MGQDEFQFNVLMSTQRAILTMIWCWIDIKKRLESVKNVDLTDVQIFDVWHQFDIQIPIENLKKNAEKVLTNQY